MSGGYGLDAGEVKALQKYFDQAGDELGMQNFPDEASLEGALTTQSVSPHENVEETVGKVVRDLTKFVDTTYPHVVHAMHKFIGETHVTLNAMAEGVAKTGVEYEAQEQRVKAWMEKYSD